MGIFKHHKSQIYACLFKSSFAELTPIELTVLSYYRLLWNLKTSANIVLEMFFCKILQTYQNWRVKHWRKGSPHNHCLIIGNLILIYLGVIGIAFLRLWRMQCFETDRTYSDKKRTPEHVRLLTVSGSILRLQHFNIRIKRSHILRVTHMLILLYQKESDICLSHYTIISFVKKIHKICNVLRGNEKQKLI